jgi:hypothetical protein
MATCRDLITDAMYNIGAWAVGEAPPAAEIQDGFNKLNQLLFWLDTQKLAIFHTVDFTGNFVPGQQNYTIGPGQNFNTSVRPTTIQNIYFTLGGISYPLKEITNNQFDAISLKSLATLLPSVFYYETSYPYGIIHFWSVPTSNSPVTISYDDQLTQFTSLTQTVSFPPAYELLLTLELSNALAPRYGTALPQDLHSQLVQVRRYIKNINHTPLYMANDPLLMNKQGVQNPYFWIYSGGFN